MKKEKRNGGPTSGGKPPSSRGKTVSVGSKITSSGGKPPSSRGKAVSVGSKTASSGGKPPSSRSRVKPEPPLELLQIGGAIYDTHITWKFRNRKNWARPDERLVTAVIPGTIQKIFIREGMQVETGTPLLILEAMKMRNEVLSPVTGTITHVYVIEGEHVPKNHLLVELAFH